MDDDVYEKVLQALQIPSYAVQPAPDVPHWTTQAGKRLPIRQLTDTHLANIRHHLISRMKYLLWLDDDPATAEVEAVWRWPAVFDEITRRELSPEFLAIHYPVTNEYGDADS